jgi:hypothetical protein
MRSHYARSSASVQFLIATSQIMLRQPFNQRADVYSFGMVLWGIYTCKQLYPHHQYDPQVFLTAS